MDPKQTDTWCLFKFVVQQKFETSQNNGRNDKEILKRDGNFKHSSLGWNLKNKQAQRLAYLKNYIYSSTRPQKQRSNRSSARKP